MRGREREGPRAGGAIGTLFCFLRSEVGQCSTLFSQATYSTELLIHSSESDLDVSTHVLALEGPVSRKPGIQSLERVSPPQPVIAGIEKATACPSSSATAKRLSIREHVRHRRYGCFLRLLPCD